MEESEEEGLERLLKWAAELGISDSSKAKAEAKASNPKKTSCLGDSLAVGHFPDAGGRGLGAVRELRKGDLVLTVPRSALLTRDRLLRDDHQLSSAVNNTTTHISLSPTQILTVGLLYEMGKGKNSWWYPYLMHLPRSYDILAAFTDFDKQALQVDDAIWTADKAISKANSEWKEASLLMEQLKLRPRLRTFRAWIWAAATISSRTLHIPWDVAGCLCPIGDLFNYAAPGEESNSPHDADSYGKSVDNANVEGVDAPFQSLTDGGYNEDVSAYCFYAKKNYKRGEQVLLSYGTYTNLELLEHYGFFLNENPNDKAFIPLEPNMYSFNSWPKDLLYVRHDGKPSFALLVTLRLWATPPNQRKSIGHLAYSGSHLSVASEISVMKWLSVNCGVILKNLPTGIEEDCVLLCIIDKMLSFQDPAELETVAKSACGSEVCAFLEANNLQGGQNGVELLLSGRTKTAMERWRLAVQWRLRYKKILLNCICYCTEIINSLSNQNVLANK